jgi:hypothetical protein
MQVFQLEVVRTVLYVPAIAFTVPVIWGLQISMNMAKNKIINILLDIEIYQSN